MRGQKRKRVKRFEEITAAPTGDLERRDLAPCCCCPCCMPTTSSITCSINLSDIIKINEDGTAVITMPKAPDCYYIDHREILEQLSKAGILEGNATYKFT